MRTFARRSSMVWNSFVRNWIQGVTLMRFAFGYWYWCLVGSVGRRNGLPRLEAAGGMLETRCSNRHRGRIKLFNSPFIVVR